MSAELSYRGSSPACAAAGLTQFADDFLLVAMQSVSLGSLARHQRPTTDGADEVITRGDPQSIAPIVLCCLVGIFRLHALLSGKRMASACGAISSVSYRVSHPH